MRTSLLVTLVLVAVPVLAAEPEKATCVFDNGPPEPCSIVFTTRRDGTSEMRAKAASGNHQAVFVGKRQSGWWAGTLDGAAAMGFERNRGNVTLSTRALSRTFEYHTSGNGHGNY